MGLVRPPKRGRLGREEQVEQQAQVRAEALRLQAIELAQVRAELQELKDASLLDGPTDSAKLERWHGVDNLRAMESEEHSDKEVDDHEECARAQVEHEKQVEARTGKGSEAFLAARQQQDQQENDELRSTVTKLRARVTELEESTKKC